jgi:RNA polymerase sigma factor (sigma-70 family)
MSARCAASLRDRAGSDAEGDDLLQEVFLRALRQKNGLCGIDNPRAWLFATARRLLIDRYRLAREQAPLPDDLVAAEEEEPAPVEGLVDCLPRVLAELSPQDREAITLCDIQGMTQQEYAQRVGLSLPAAKSRVQRARGRGSRRRWRKPAASSSMPTASSRDSSPARDGGGVGRDNPRLSIRPGKTL